MVGGGLWFLVVFGSMRLIVFGRFWWFGAV